VFVRLLEMVRFNDSSAQFSAPKRLLESQALCVIFVSCEDESPELVVMATLRSRVRMLAGLERGPAGPGHFHGSRSARTARPG